MKTCIDAKFAEKAGFMMTKIPKPILVEYADGTVVEGSTIRYLVNVRIRATRVTVVTGALVMHLETLKVFLGYAWLQVVNPRIDWRNQKVETEEGETPIQMQTLQEGPPNYPKLYEEVFFKQAFQGLPPRRMWDHWINLVPGHASVRGRCYPLATREWAALKEFSDMNLATGKIRKSESPDVSLFFFWLKPGMGELCGIQDYWKLNKIIIKDRYPLPLISDMLSCAKESRIFTKMDLRWGFNNIRIWEGDEHKAVFVTPLGLYEPNVMQFGLCNALSTFPWMIDDVLAQERNSSHIEVYVDDILVHMPDITSNQYWTGRVLSKLAEHHLHCWAEKCQSEKEEVEFLGVLLGEGSLKVSPGKVQAICDEKLPMNWKGVQRFLGITNYHWWFIKGYLTLARPLHDLTKDVEFVWSKECQEAFDGLKQALTTAPMLALLVKDGKFRLETDASDVVTGAVLYQEQKDGSYQLVGYSSKSYNDAEWNYMAYNKEMLTIMRALEEWRSLLIGTEEPFEILTDHWNLTYLENPRSSQADRLTGWQSYRTMTLSFDT
jgi:hypothetical protein